VKIDGRCHCGFISYEAEIDPGKVEICHCADCQVLSGSAFRTLAPVEKNTFKILSGQPKTYVKTADSGTERAQMFCPECGTPIFSSAADGGPPLYVRVATARQRNQLPPKTQYWVRSAQAWVADLRSLPSVEEQ
jgi:hypothetical protein